MVKYKQCLENIKYLYNSIYSIFKLLFILILIRQQIYLIHILFIIIFYIIFTLQFSKIPKQCLCSYIPQIIERLTQLEQEVYGKKQQNKETPNNKEQQQVKQELALKIQQLQQYEKQIQDAEKETKEKEQKLLETSTTIQEYMKNMKQGKQNQELNEQQKQIIQQFEQQKQLLDTLASAWASTNSIFVQIYNHLKEILQLPDLDQSPASMVTGMQNLGQKLVEFCIQVEELKKQKLELQKREEVEQNEEKQEE